MYKRKRINELNILKFLKQMYCPAYLDKRRKDSDMSQEKEKGRVIRQTKKRILWLGALQNIFYHCFCLDVVIVVDFFCYF